ncbi:uncharacterized protein LOC114859907 isoform X2 [Betta splendens]|uniref:Uncharacterized protein LOC114859907 isoform X2 n=1 Tax=Betta splendens TaxID=158456 RepID=A0A9W2XZ00_BETSP|nr:uncharacterized protein LOC114859907 isoform X2 [Betta splendens]
MSAAWMRLAAVLCLSGPVLADPESEDVLWRACGESVTIQCRSSEPQLKHLDLRKGLNKYVSVLQQSAASDHRIGGEFTERVQGNGAFPNVDVLIKNLTSGDTGVYRCMYRQANQTGTEAKQGSGSVLVVVRDRCRPACCPAPEEQSLVPVWVMVGAAALLTVVMCLLMWLIKTKTAAPAEATTYATMKPGSEPGGSGADVYEEMRGALGPPPAGAMGLQGAGEGDAGLSA